MLFPFLLRHVIDLAIQKWLLQCPYVCLVTLTPQRPIVTKNMCVYGCKVDLNRVLLLTVAMQLRMNCFDDLFVPTDMVWFPFSFSFVQCMSHFRSDSRLMI